MPGTTLVNSPDGSDGEESACSAGDPGQMPGTGRSLEKERAATLVFLPGKARGQRSLVGYSPRGLKESDMTERDENCG